MLMSPTSGKSWSSMAKSSVFRTGRGFHRLGRANGSRLMVRFGPQDPSGPWAGRESQRADLGAERQAERSGRSAGLGREALKGPAGSTVRAGQSGPKALEGRMGTWAGQFSGTARRAERLARGSVTGKLAKWQQMSPQPYCDKAFRVCQNRLPKRKWQQHFGEF